MKFTTHLELESRPARLFEQQVVRGELWVKDGILTLYDALFQKTYTQNTRWLCVSRLQFGERQGSQIFSLSSSRFTRRY